MSSQTEMKQESEPDSEMKENNYDDYDPSVCELPL